MIYLKLFSYRCSHGRGFNCNICNQYNTETTGLSRNGIEISLSPSSPSVDRISRSEIARDDRHEVIDYE